MIPRIGKGKLIVLDGADGSGKATQAQLLIQHLRRLGYKVQYADFPQYETTFFGKMIGEFQMGKFGDSVVASPYLSSLLYAGDRYQASGKIKQWLSQDAIVIANRYASSNAAHQGGKLKPADRKKFLQWVNELEYSVFGIPREDMVIFLDLPVKISQKLVLKKGDRGYTKGRHIDQAEQHTGHQQAALEVYRELTKQNKNWHKIDCTKNTTLLLPTEIHAKVWQIVEPLVK